MDQHSHLYAKADRADCVRSDACRSPYVCRMAKLCVDAITPEQERVLLEKDTGAMPRKHPWKRDAVMAAIGGQAATRSDGAADSASGSEPEGREFESLSERQEFE